MHRNFLEKRISFILKDIKDLNGEVSHSIIKIPTIIKDISFPKIGM